MQARQGARQSPITDAERQMQQCWYELAMAEQAGQPQEILENLFDLYLCAVEEYFQWCAPQKERLAS
jgi:hypothetical protein